MFFPAPLVEKQKKQLLPLQIYSHLQRSKES